MQDLLRKATAKTLARPDPETNQQVGPQGKVDSTIWTKVQLEQLYRWHGQVTAKLPADLQVVEAVGDGLSSSTLDLQTLDSLLYARLTLNNPHKVWLAIELIRLVRHRLVAFLQAAPHCPPDRPCIMRAAH